MMTEPPRDGDRASTPVHLDHLNIITLKILKWKSRKHRLGHQRQTIEGKCEESQRADGDNKTQTTPSYVVNIQHYNQNVMTFAIFYFTSSSILRNSFPAREERRDHLPVGSATIEGLRDRGLRDRDMGGDMSSSSERRSSPDRVRDREWSSLVEPNKLPDLDRVTNSSSSSSGNIVSLLICIISSSKMSIEPRRE